MSVAINVDTLTDVPGLTVGQAEDSAALTGCTVIVCEQGAACGVDVRGAAPGTRETDLLHPINSVTQVHAVCLCGGSAFGLDAAGGVMRFLEERGVGLSVGVGVVPIVPAAVLFDLAIGNPHVRPDADMGYQAAASATRDPVRQGNVGAGCGATVGKLAGFARAMKSGLGSASHRLADGLVIGALVALNAVGEVRDPATGRVLAGARGEDGRLLDSLSLLADRRQAWIPPGANTTLAVVATNASLTKTQLSKVAQMAHDGLARTIYPVHTMRDGDTVFALSTGAAAAVETDIVGVWAAEVLATAVLRAVRAAHGVGGLPAYCDLFG